MFYVKHVFNVKHTHSSDVEDLQRRRRKVPIPGGEWAEHATVNVGTNLHPPSRAQ